MFSLPPLRRTFSAALRDLASERPEVRASAARDLVLTGDEAPRRAADALSPLLRDPVADVRAAALEALGGLDAGHLIDPIAACFDDADSNVRQRAVMAVADLGGSSALARLRAAIDHAEPDVRYQCLLGIAQHQPSEGVSLALKALDSTDPWIAAEAALLLGQRLCPKAASEHPPLGEDDRARVLDALARKIEGAPSAEQRVAVFALARVGDARGLAALIELVASSPDETMFDEDHSLFDAIDMLGGAQGALAPKAVEALRRHALRMLPTERRAFARAALVRHGDPGYSEEITELLGSALGSRRNLGVRMAHLARLSAASETIAAAMANERVDALPALAALGAIGDETARAALDRVARTDARAERRSAAREALARIGERT